MTAPRSVTSRLPMRSQVQALIDDDFVWDAGARLEVLADATADPTLGGRPRAYPLACAVIWDALVAVFGSSRQVEVELSCPDSGWWDLVRSAAIKSEIVLPAAPMRRHHYAYLRDRYLSHDDGQLAELAEVFTTRAAELAVAIGLCDPDGDGSLTHPHPDRVVAGDGKVVTPRYKTHPRRRRSVDKRTGEVRARRVDPDAALHVTGGGERVFGTKYVFLSTRGDARNQRIILGIAHSPTKGGGGEAGTAITALDSVLPLLPGAQAVVYDGAFRGVHLRHLIKTHGVIPLARVHKAAGGERPDHHLPRTPGNGTAPSATPPEIHLVNGAPHARTIAVDGTPILHPLTRNRLVRRRDQNGWRLYGEYTIADTAGGAKMRIRLDQTTEDVLAGFNREEHLRPIPPDDPDHPTLYGRRNDTESGNRLLDDSMLRERAHTVGRRRQLLNMITWAAVRNSSAARQHAPPKSHAPPQLAA